MAERVSEERLSRLALVCDTSPGFRPLFDPGEVRALISDLRDARAERDALKERVRALEGEVLGVEPERCAVCQAPTDKSCDESAHSKRGRP
jgi:hypothetical protein